MKLRPRADEHGLSRAPFAAAGGRWPEGGRAARLLAAGVLCAALGVLSGCSNVLSKLGDDRAGIDQGITFYLGGAGTFGSIGNLSVKQGLRAGKWPGAILVIPWQSWFGDVLRDQIDRGRNVREAEGVAREIVQYQKQYPGRRVNIIALSAGTGIATWALEKLPEGVNVGTVVFLGSSLSRKYDLSAALRHIEGKLYVFYSGDDPILRYGLPIAGTVDREFEGASAAGLYGFALPGGASREVIELYNSKVRNMAWKPKYSRLGYRGRHTDGTSAEFVAAVIAPLMREPLERPPPAGGERVARGR